MKEDKVELINSMIEVLKNIRDNEDIKNIDINSDIKVYTERDHTKGLFVKSRRIGRKITFTIKQGVMVNTEKTFSGISLIYDEDD